MIKGRHKYGAQRTEVDGITFHSKKEAKRYQELKLLELAGEIHSLTLQPRFQLSAKRQCDPVGRGIELGHYVGDFSYYDKRLHNSVVEDVKGFRTPLYRWKKKHVEAQYGITIREV